jgi:pseudouridine-5'-phosphate glycosidase
MNMSVQPMLEYGAEAAAAKERNLPIIALESTIISHGMPYPQNVQTAREVEQIVRDHGAVPATIGIMNGKIKVGLTDDELEFFAKSRDIRKVSRRDMPAVLQQKLYGATTVGATMICAQLAGIRFFVTGGIGGVHREAERTMDVSADLTELGRTDVAVVCAGAKSILDIGKTLEYLETLGVPVLGYQTDEFPAFYSRNSGFPLEYRLDSPEEAAALIKTKWDLGLKGGVVIANPVPQADEIPQQEIEAVIENAIALAKQQNVTGKRVTPFLLNEIKRLTGGGSLRTNIALVKHNARVGAQIAASYSKL